MYMDPYSYRNKVEILSAIDATKSDLENFGDNGRINFEFFLFEKKLDI